MLAPLQTTWSDGSVTAGVGLTVMVKLCGVPTQTGPAVLGVTVIVATTGVVPALVAVKAAIVPPEPDAASPIDGAPPYADGGALATATSDVSTNPGIAQGALPAVPAIPELPATTGEGQYTAAPHSVPRAPPARLPSRMRGPDPHRYPRSRP